MSLTDKTQSIGIIGFGIMGQGIAALFALKGYNVTVRTSRAADPDSFLPAFKKNLTRAIRRDAEVEMSVDEALELIEFVGDFDSFSNCGLVIEAVSEEHQKKREVMSALAGKLRDDCILASNTSSFSITQLASYSDRPKRFLGIHFMNPAVVMPLVEVIRGMNTDRGVIDDVKALVESLGKTVVLPADVPGFMLNRILLPMINEAIYALWEGVGDVASIDATLKGGANHPMGPLELADLIGLDTCLAIMNKLNSGMADPKYRPCPLLVRYVEAGWLGRKTKIGFYDYAKPGRPATWPLV